MISGPELIDDVRKAPDNILCMRGPVDDVRKACKVDLKWSARAHEDYLSSFKQIIRWIC